MPSFIESLAAGGKQWGEYAQGVEAARTAPQMAQAELAKQQAGATILGQQATLGQYDVEAASLLKQAATPVGPSQDYSAIYSQTSSLKQKQDLAKQKLAKAEQLRNATMASGKFSESTRKAYEDAQAEVKSVDTEFKTFQAESLRKVLDPALTARDQSSWDMAKPQLAAATAEAAVQEAIKSGVPEANIERLRNDVRNQTLASLPKAWGQSAQNFVRSKAAELSSLETSNKMDKQVRDEEEHKMKMKEYQSKIAENYAQRDKAINEAKAGNPKAVADSVKLLKDIVNTESLELNRITADEEMVAKKQMEVADEARSSWFGDKTTEESDYQTAKANYDNIQVRKANAQKILDKAQSDLSLTLAMAKEAGVEVPKDTPPPKPIDLSGYQITPAAQGYTAEQVLQGIADVSPGATDAQIIAKAVESGLIVKGTVKAVTKAPPKVEPNVVPKKKNEYSVVASGKSPELLAYEKSKKQTAEDKQTLLEIGSAFAAPFKYR